MKILHISHIDWTKYYDLPDELEWYHYDPDSLSVFDAGAVDCFELVIVDVVCRLEDLERLDSKITPYTLLIDQAINGEFDETYDDYFFCKMADYVDMSSPQEFIDLIPRKYFPGQFGQKFLVRKILFSPKHTGKVWFEGTKYISTNIDYEDDFRQLLFWKVNMEYENKYTMELWPVYKIDEGCSIEYDIQLIKSGSPDVILSHTRYSEEELQTPIVFSGDCDGYLACSVFVKGKGLVQIGPIRYRHSRLGAGQFLPGGERISCSGRQELFYYFHPGNMKPPLNVYFSGYRSEGGFEGLAMMKGFGHPAIIVFDPGMEGGNYYIGSKELDEKFQTVIRRYMELLNFGEEDLIFSGISMGSFAAMYYGYLFKVHAVIVCKPILDPVYVADRTRLIRPYDFLTSLDIVKYWDRTDEEGNIVPLEEFKEDLKKKWSSENGFGDTKLLLAYMEQDDYDDQAYYSLLDTLSGKKTTIIARGYQGRHNDDNNTIVAWFAHHYGRVINEYVESEK